MLKFLGACSSASTFEITVSRIHTSYFTVACVAHSSYEAKELWKFKKPPFSVQHTTCDFEHDSGKVVSRSGTCISTGTATDIHTCKHTYVSKYIHTYVQVHTHTSTRIGVYARTTFACTCVHTYIGMPTNILTFKSVNKHTGIQLWIPLRVGVGH